MSSVESARYDHACPQERPNVRNRPEQYGTECRRPDELGIGEGCEDRSIAKAERDHDEPVAGCCRATNYIRVPKARVRQSGGAHTIGRRAMRSSAPSGM